MDLIIDRTQALSDADTAEAPRHHSLDLALQRMGFRPRPDRQPQPRWPRTWPQRTRDDTASDWRPL